MSKPVMAWDSQEGFADGCVWWSRLDGRFQVEVQVGDRPVGNLVIFDHDDGDSVVYSEPVTLAYGAVFGPDVEDVAAWKRVAVKVIDAYTGSS